MKPFLTTDCEPQWQTPMNTDGEKTLTRIARIFAKGSGAGWGYLPYGRRAQLAGGPPALRMEMKSAKRAVKTRKLNQIKPD